MVNKEYIIERTIAFKAAVLNFGDSLKYDDENTCIVEGDSLELIKKIPDNCISLILTDPPYHSTKKGNITNDTAFQNDEAFIKWIESYSIEWKRVLRPNGSLFVFCSSSMSGKIEAILGGRFNVLSHIVWTKPNDPGFDGWKQKMKKETLRQWYAHSERILFAEPCEDGNLFRSSLGNFLRQKRLESGLSGHQLTEMIKAYGKVNHGGAVSNWEAGRNIPNREQYEKICNALISSRIGLTMPPYEDIVRPFFVDSTVEFTDVWNFNSVRPYNHKHPAEKPIDMLEHCIATSTYENDIILDCFAGSGSTAFAATNLKRKSIVIELEAKWVNLIVNRMQQYDREHYGSIVKKHGLKKVPKESLNDHATLSLF